MISIGDTVKVRIQLGDKTSRISECIVTNVYEKRETLYYTVKEKNGIYKCSNCGELCYVEEIKGKPTWRYCPYCGAKMD